MIPLSLKVWGGRAFLVFTIVFLCWLVDSPNPALAFALAWGPNGLFLAAFMKGNLHLPRLLERVHAMELVLYRWIGVGLVKRLVATDVWPMMVGIEQAPMPRDRKEFLVRVDLSTKGAEICHGLTFMLALTVTVVCVTVGWNSAAGWILVFNVALNGYPVMLQRSNRWRLQQVHANHSRY